MVSRAMSRSDAPEDREDGRDGRIRTGGPLVPMECELGANGFAAGYAVIVRNNIIFCIIFFY